MSNPALLYNGQTIDLGKMPRRYQASMGPPRTVRLGVGGSNEIVTEPRVVHQIVAEWLIDTAALKLALENWWQWAQRGGSFQFAMDASDVVDTTVAVAAAAGDTVVWVNSPSGIAAGTYRIIDGENHQTVTVSSISADKVTLSTGLLWAVGVDAIFRDEYYLPGFIPDGTAYPFQVLSPDEGQIAWPPTRAIFTLQLREDISQESTMLLKVLAANETGSDVNTAQDWFPSNGDVSVAANTTYLLEGELRLSRSAGTTSHTTGILFGGTATLTGIKYKALCNTGDTVANIAENGISGEVATVIVLKAASTSATEQISIRVTGVVRINAAGTFIPQFQYSAAPGGAPSVLANSYFKLVPLGSGSFTAQGTWA